MSTQANKADAEPPVPPLQLSQHHRLVPATGVARRQSRTARLIATPVVALSLAGVGAALVLSNHAGPRPVAQPALAVVSREKLRAGMHDRPARAHAAAGVAHVSVRSPVTASAVVASPHVLSGTELVSLASGATSYDPAPALVGDYRAAAARYRIPWRLLAAVEYVTGGYGDVRAGPATRGERALARQVRSSGALGLDGDLLAQVAGQATGPSPALLRVASRLVAAGARRSPGAAVAAALGGTGVSAQAVLTLAQATDTRLAAKASPRARIRAMLAEARLLNGLPYVWGGGHTNPAWVVGSGYDCSGFVSAVLHAGGYLDSPDTTQTLPGSPGILSGRGRYVTIYDRTIATLRVRVEKRETRTVRRVVAPNTLGVHVTRGRRARGADAIAITLPRWVGAWKTVRVTRLVPSEDTTNNDEHVIIDINGQWWESGGATGDGGAAMVHRILHPNPAYLKSFNRILHPQGL